jgi:hypothetical protein
MTETMQVGQRLKLKYSKRKTTIGNSDDVVEMPVLGSVTALRGGGEFRVSYDRQHGEPRARYWYTPDQASGFDTIGGSK